MTIRVFDFVCLNRHKSEQFVSPETRAVQCPECDQLALRQPAAPRAKLEPFTGAFPSAADKWVRDRDGKMKVEKRNLERHGTYT